MLAAHGPTISLAQGPHYHHCQAHHYHEGLQRGQLAYPAAAIAGILCFTDLPCFIFENPVLNSPAYAEHNGNVIPNIKGKKHQALRTVCK